MARPAQNGDQVTIDIHGTRAGRLRRRRRRPRRRGLPLRGGERGGGPRARRPAAGGQGRRHLHLRLHHRPRRPGRFVPGAGEGRQGAGASRGERRVGLRSLRVRHGRRAAGRSHQTAEPAPHRPGPDGPGAEDRRRPGGVGHRGHPRPVGGGGGARADSRPQPPSGQPGDEPGSVPRGHRPRRAGVPRGAPQRRPAQREARPGPPVAGRRGGHRAHRRGVRRGAGGHGRTTGDGRRRGAGAVGTVRTPPGGTLGQAQGEGHALAGRQCRSGR